MYTWSPIGSERAFTLIRIFRSACVPPATEMQSSGGRDAFTAWKPAETVNSGTQASNFKIDKPPHAARGSGYVVSKELGLEGHIYPIMTPKKKRGHNRKGTTLESLDI